MLHDVSDEPINVGLEKEPLRRLDALCKSAIAEGWLPSAVYMVIRHGKVAASGAFGDPMPESVPRAPATLETLFDMASLTKPITAALLLQCVQDGEVHLGMRVSEFLPETADRPIASVTLRQLATHTGGLAAWKPLYSLSEGSIVERVMSFPLEVEPGTRYTYSDLGYILLGEIVSRVRGKSLDRAAREHVFDVLGMKNTDYLPVIAPGRSVAATANCGWRPGQTLAGEVHDANAHGMAGVAGHAGIFSTVNDMARFALAFREPSVAAPGSLLLSPLATLLAQTNQIEPSVGGHSIGWFTFPNGMLPGGDLLSRRCFGHTGFTGTSLLLDPEYDLQILLLTNRVYSPAEGGNVLRFRRRFANVVASAIR